MDVVLPQLPLVPTEYVSFETNASAAPRSVKAGRSGTPVDIANLRLGAKWIVVGFVLTFAAAYGFFALAVYAIKPQSSAEVMQISLIGLMIAVFVGQMLRPVGMFCCLTRKSRFEYHLLIWAIALTTIAIIGNIIASVAAFAPPDPTQLMMRAWISIGAGSADMIGNLFLLQFLRHVGVTIGKPSLAQSAQHVAAFGLLIIVIIVFGLVAILSMGITAKDMLDSGAMGSIFLAAVAASLIWAAMEVWLLIRVAGLQPESSAS